MLPEPIEVPGEKIYELVTAADGLGFGVALVELTESREHVHHRITERYKLVSSAIELFVNGRMIQLVARGTTIVIPPGVRHWARCRNGTPASVLDISTPAWTPEDHHVVASQEAPPSTP